MAQNSQEKAPREGDISGPCESCLYYDYDEDWEEYICTVRMDQDDYSSVMGRKNKGCPYYRFYDEYKSVHKQI